MLARTPEKGQNIGPALPFRDIARMLRLGRAVDLPRRATWYVGSVTASLPVPNDIDPEEPDGHASPRVAPVKSPAPQQPKKPRQQRKPKTKRPASDSSAAPQAVASEKSPPETPPVADPGPPPPLPSDLEVVASVAADIVVPPRPPLPAEPPTSAQPAIDGTHAETPGAAEENADVVDEVPVEVEPEAPAATAADVVDDAPVEVESEAPVATAADVVDEVPVEVESEVPAATAADVVDEAPVEVEPEVPAATAAEASVVVPAPEAPAAAPEPPVAGPETPVTVPEAAAEPGREPMPVPTPAPGTSGDALVLRGVTKRFGSTHAVDGIDLTVPAGTFYGLVGPNGAGKTTTLSMIAGLLEPDKGSIRVAGVDASAKPLAAKKLMGVLPDRLRTFDRLTGRQLLYYYGVLRGLPPAVVESRTADLARAFDLEDALGRSVSDYSAGMLKKVMLAGALIHSPRLLVLDEPFEAVDPVSSAVILDILSTYVAHGGTVILSSHGMELVERVCSRVAVIVAGQVLAEGTVDEVRGELTLEQRFVELAGGLSDVEGLEWLHTFSN